MNPTFTRKICYSKRTLRKTTAFQQPYRKRPGVLTERAMDRRVKGCKCSVLGTGQFAVIPLTMNTSCQKVFKDNERSPVKQMRCSQEQHKIPILISQQQPKNTFRVMEGPGQHKSHCLGNLERTTHVGKPSNILEIKGERSKNPTGDIKDQCNILFN